MITVAGEPASVLALLPGAPDASPGFDMRVVPTGDDSERFDGKRPGPMNLLER
jgi:hypothetical protein